MNNNRINEYLIYLTIISQSFSHTNDQHFRVSLIRTKIQKENCQTKRNFIKIIEYPVAPHATSLIPPPNLKPPLPPPTSFLSPSPTHSLSHLILARISLSVPSPFVPTFVYSTEAPY